MSRKSVQWEPSCSIRTGKQRGYAQMNMTKLMVAFRNFSNAPKNLHYFSACNYTRVGTLIVATIYLQLIQNRYMFPSFTALQCSHQHCVQPVASDVEVVGYL